MELSPPVAPFGNHQVLEGHSILGGPFDRSAAENSGAGAVRHIRIRAPKSASGVRARTSIRAGSALVE
jgi:hypothetical protein